MYLELIKVIKQNKYNNNNNNNNRESLTSSEDSSEESVNIDDTLDNLSTIYSFNSNKKKRLNKNYDQNSK
jgi:hypothetical protein